MNLETKFLFDRHYSADLELAILQEDLDIYWNNLNNQNNSDLEIDYLNYNSDNDLGIDY